MKKIKLILLLVILSFTLTGCTRFLTDAENNAVINEETGQRLPLNILCRPADQTILDLYVEHADQAGFDVNELPRCENMRLFDANRENGLWDQLFVIPLSWYITRLALIVGNYGIALMLAGIAIRIILTPLTLKMIKQSENMKKAKPEMDLLEKKYKNKKDQESNMKKGQEMMAIYKKHNVSMVGSCLNTFLQLPLFLAFLGAINRTPAIFEETLWTLQLGTTPWVGIQAGNYLYLVLIILLIVTTYLSFKFNMTMMGNSDQQRQMKFVLNIMLIFISFASFTLPTAIGLYWVVSSAFMVVTNFIFKRPKELLEKVKPKLK